MGSAVQQAARRGIPWIGVASRGTNAAGFTNYGISGFEMTRLFDKWFFKTVYQGQQAVVEKAVDKVADDFVATVLTKKVTRPPTPPVPPTRR